jgi:type IV secretory pathway VirB2 component (pilin)
VVKKVLKILKKQSKKIIFSVFALAILLSPMLALAAWELPDVSGMNLPTGTLSEVVLNITDWILGFAGILALLFIIWGGIQYTTASGNEDQMQNAKKTIQWGIIGLVIVGLSYAIVKTVVGFMN